MNSCIKRKISLFCLLFFFSSLSCMEMAYSRGPAEVSFSGGRNSVGDNEKKTIKEMDVRVRLLNPRVDPSEIPSLLFTSWEHELIRDAKVGFTSRIPTQAELDAEEEALVKESLAAGVRDISLAGIVFKGPDDWTIWLNDQRITPKSIPEEVTDIKVNKDYVELKWFDAYTRQIYPIRMRAHQRFNLDSRIFFPG